MDINTKEIIDVFHAYAYTEVDDNYARKYVHGLNPKILKSVGYRDLNQLIDDFQSWIRRKHCIALYGNAPAKEATALQYCISPFNLPEWRIRQDMPYHIVAGQFKKHNVPILSKRCNTDVHSAFKYTIVRPYSSTDTAKERHGCHCSLYDCYELYLYYIHLL
jgi:hypothetical protein